MTLVKSQAKQAQPDFTIQVKTRLLELGLNVTKLAAHLGLSRNTVSTAIHHPTMFLDVQRRIKEALELP